MILSYCADSCSKNAVGALWSSFTTVGVNGYLEEADEAVIIKNLNYLLKYTYKVWASPFFDWFAEQIAIFEKSTINRLILQLEIFF